MSETLIEAGIKRPSLALVLRGIVAVIFGVIVSIWPVAAVVTLVWPGLTVLALTLVIGFWAILLGVSQLVLAFQFKKVTNSWWLWLVTGIITLVFGLILVFAPGAGVLSLL